jgi:hypothetical protein
MSEDRSQRSENRGQRTEVGGRRPKVGTAFVLILILAPHKFLIHENEHENDEICSLQPHVEGMDSVYFKKA